MKKQLFLLLCGFWLWGNALAQNLSGHGGAVQALSVQGAQLLSGGFDNRAILWDLTQNKAIAVLNGHEAGVRRVLLSPQGVFTGGEDGFVLKWEGEKPQRLQQHQGGVVALAISKGGILLSASRFGEISVGSETFNVPTAHLIGADFMGETPISLTAEGILTFHGVQERVIKLNLQATAFHQSDTALYIGTASGEVLTLSFEGAVLRRQAALETPITAFAVSKDYLAAASIASTVVVFERETGKRLYALQGAGLPVWSLAFEGENLLTGGGDKLIRRWNAATGEALGAMVTRVSDDNAAFAGSEGARAFRACAFCHALEVTSEIKAGPTLLGVKNRKVGTVAGYVYSKALQESNVVWTQETLEKLFEIGPQTYLPGTKMPEQLVGEKATRAALVEFILSR